MLLFKPLAVTYGQYWPVARLLGTVHTICVLLQLVTGAFTLPTTTTPVPCVAPKFVPVKVTDVPVGPEVGDMLLTLGAVCAHAGLAEKKPATKSEKVIAILAAWRQSNLRTCKEEDRSAAITLAAVFFMISSLRRWEFEAQQESYK